MSTLSSVSGDVLDQNGQALPGVVVSFEGENTEHALTTVTDDKGQFLLRDLASGPFLVAANMEGFMDWKKTAFLEPGQNFRVRITMYSL